MSRVKINTYGFTVHINCYNKYQSGGGHSSPLASRSVARNFAIFHSIQSAISSSPGLSEARLVHSRVTLTDSSAELHHIPRRNDSSCNIWPHTRRLEPGRDSNFSTSSRGAPHVEQTRRSTCLGWLAHVSPKAGQKRSMISACRGRCTLCLSSCARDVTGCRWSRRGSPARAAREFPCCCCGSLWDRLATLVAT